MVSKANFQQAPVHWPREITKTKQSQAKYFIFTSFYQTMGKKGNLGTYGQVWVSLGKFGQVWASWDKCGEGNKLKNWEKRQKE